ncbi:MAG TPA: 6-phosphofructokinase, partial [Cystobacter sp.]
MKVAVLTGGGDCPGLNAVIRAVVRRASAHGFEMMGLRDGWKGLLDDNHFRLTRETTSGILHRGGTILGTSRVNPFKVENGLERV